MCARMPGRGGPRGPGASATEWGQGRAMPTPGPPPPGLLKGAARLLRRRRQKRPRPGGLNASLAAPCASALHQRAARCAACRCCSELQ